MTVAAAISVAMIASVAVKQRSTVATRVSGANMTFHSLGLHSSAAIGVG